MTAGFRSFAARMVRDTSANALALVGIGIVPLVGAVGAGVDIAQWVLWKRELHTSADLGALAGARALADKQNVELAVRRSLGHNNQRSFTIEAIENAPVSGPFAGDVAKVRVVLATARALPFSGMFLTAAPTIRVEATAENAKTTPNCVITLDTSGTGVSITGSSKVNMNCGLSSNSNFDATSSDTINAGALSAVGTVTTGGAVSTTTKINNGVPAQTDPYSGKLPQPNAQAGCSPNTWPLIKADYTIDPAVDGNCFQGLQIQGGTTTLQAGVYYIGEKGISVAAGAGLKGTNVTLILTSTASSFNDKKVGSLDISGSATVELTAPTSGTYKGVIIYQDPRTPDTSQNILKVTGNSSSIFQGAIYAPSVGVTFTGNTTVDSSGGTIFANTACMQIVSLRATFTGNTSVSNTCPGGSGAAAYGGSGTVRLVR